jgi:hypothetical protein
VPLDPFIDQPGSTLVFRLSWSGQPVCPPRFPEKDQVNENAGQRWRCLVQM